MRYIFALGLLATASEAAFALGGDHDHDHGHGGHSHANEVKLDIVKDANYHMTLAYMVEPDKFGDKWLVFESKLEAEAGEFQDGWFVSQWF